MSRGWQMRSAPRRHTVRGGAVKAIHRVASPDRVIHRLTVKMPPNLLLPNLPLYINTSLARSLLPAFLSLQLPLP
jgi:hypothetical protein